MTWLRVGIAAAVVCFVGVAASCREPTEILVELTTDVSCSDVGLAGGAILRVGAPGTVESSPTTSVVALSCEGGKLGTIAVVPSGSDDDQVAILAVLGSGKNPALPFVKTADCNASAPGNCILTKRVVSYITHRTLSLPIRLSLACAGVTCKNPNETCVEGECRSVVPECTEADGCKPVPPPVDAGPSLDATLDARPDVISTSDVAVIDVGAPDGCNMCGGSTCVNLLSDPSNCGACGLKCGGVCAGGLCKLSAGVANALGGCIAVDGEVVMFTAGNGTAGAAYWVPRTGTSAATKLDTFATPSWVAGGGGLTVSGQNGTASSFRDYTATVPPAPVSGLVTIGNNGSEINGLARNSSGQRCLAFRDGNLHYAACPSKNALQLAGPSGPLAVGTNGWAAIMGPSLPAATFQLGDFTGASQGTLPLAKARTVTAIRTGNQLYAAVDTTIVTYLNSKWNPVWSGSLPVRGLRVDAAGTLYFIEGTATGAVRKLTYTGAPVSTNQAPVLYTGPFDSLGEPACIDVDDVAFYLLVSGIPIRGPK